MCGRVVEDLPTSSKNICNSGSYTTRDYLRLSNPFSNKILRFFSGYQLDWHKLTRKSTSKLLESRTKHLKPPPKPNHKHMQVDFICIFYALLLLNAIVQPGMVSSGSAAGRFPTGALRGWNLPPTGWAGATGCGAAAECARAPADVQPFAVWNLLRPGVGFGGLGMIRSKTWSENQLSC